MHVKHPVCHEPISVLINVYIYIYIYIYKTLKENAIVRLHHTGSGDSQTKKRFQHPLLASKPATMALRVLKRPSLPTNPNAKGIEP